MTVVVLATQCLFCLDDGAARLFLLLLCILQASQELAVSML